MALFMIYQSAWFIYAVGQFIGRRLSVILPVMFITAILLSSVCAL